MICLFQKTERSISIFMGKIVETNMHTSYAYKVDFTSSNDN